MDSAFKWYAFAPADDEIIHYQYLTLHLIFLPCQHKLVKKDEEAVCAPTWHHLACQCVCLGCHPHFWPTQSYCHSSQGWTACWQMYSAGAAIGQKQVHLYLKYITWNTWSNSLNTVNLASIQKHHESQGYKRVEEYFINVTVDLISLKMHC